MWASLHQADSGRRHLFIASPNRWPMLLPQDEILQSLWVSSLSLLVCFHWQYISSYITLSDQFQFESPSREKDGILDVIPMFDPIALIGLNPPSGVLRCHIGCWLVYSAISTFGSFRRSENCGNATCLPNARPVNLIFILISIMCSPEKTCGAPQDLCFSADPPPA